MSKSKYAKIVAAYRTDLSLGLQWARANKAITGSAEVVKSGDVYYARVKLKKGRAALRNLISDRFGSFIKVK
tara:strand:+ start:583 stop:798 length:216 start_codon:yes stop_codon:yes gene_type:complete